MQKKLKQGFSIIELMVVIAVVGILSSLAVGSYRQHMVKAHLASVLTLWLPYQSALNEYQSLYNIFPANISALNLPSTINNEDIISINYNPSASHQTALLEVFLNPARFTTGLGFGTNPELMLWGLQSGNQVRWQCLNNNVIAGRFIPPEFSPSSCQMSLFTNGFDLSH